MSHLHLLECLDFIDRFKPATHPETDDLMVIDLRLPREAMQEICQALTETGIRHYLAGGGTMMCFDRRAYEMLRQQTATAALSEPTAARKLAVA